MTITQHAQQLLQKITDARTECRERPIIFVAHSLGGILVKDMIIQSAKYEHQLKFLDINKSTSAIIFFGTPHLGANAARCGEIVSNIVGSLPGGWSVYKELLRGLKPDREKLSNINADMMFSTRIFLRRIRFRSTVFKRASLFRVSNPLVERYMSERQAQQALTRNRSFPTLLPFSIVGTLSRFPLLPKTI